MKKFEINVDINGTITFEVQAKNRKDAQKQVDDILSNDSVSELEIPDFSKVEVRKISQRYKKYLDFKRLSSEIIELEKERNDALFFSKEASV